MALKPLMLQHKKIHLWRHRLQHRWRSWPQHQWLAWRHRLQLRWRHRPQHQWRPTTNNLFKRQRRRRRRRQRLGQQPSEEIDRINQLPDSVLLHIFSFLSTFDAMYLAGFVSKGWSSLIWSSLPSLVFRQSNLKQSYDDKMNIQRFILYVDDVLRFHNRNNFERCCFDFNYNCFSDNYKYHKKKMDSWIRLALYHKVKNLELLFCNSFRASSCSLPSFLFRNEVLATLSLQWVNFEGCTREINWKSLTSLSIKQADLTDMLLQKILVGCPSLGYLKLASCRGIKRLEIVSSTLRQLVLHNCGLSSGSDYVYSSEECGEMLQILAPFLEELSVSGYMYYKKCSVMNLSCLVKATLGFNMDDRDRDRDRDRYRYRDSDNDSDSDSDNDGSDEENTRNNKLNIKSIKILGTVRHVKKLTLGTWVLQVLVAEYQSISFINCKSLTLDIDIEQWELPGLASMLQNCPELESLTINTPLWSPNYSGVKHDYDEEKNFWELNPIYKSCNCLLRHLKTVNIVGLCHDKGSKQVIEFLQFILQHAMVLETLSIDVDKKPHHGYKPKKLDEDEYFHQQSVFYMLTSFPRSSPAAVIQVISNNKIRRVLRN